MADKKRQYRLRKDPAFEFFEKLMERNMPPDLDEEDEREQWVVDQFVRRVVNKPDSNLIATAGDEYPPEELPFNTVPGCALVPGNGWFAWQEVGMAIGDMSRLKDVDFE